MKALKATGIQYAALPYRVEGRQTQILLITSRRTKRWVIPKGWPMRDLAPHAAAAVEAAEEAGLSGVISERPIGSYRYLKQLKDERMLTVQVLVFPFKVEDVAAAFKESSQRVSRWFRYQEAARLVAEPGLRQLIREFGADRAPNPLLRSLRRYWRWRTRR